MGHQVFLVMLNTQHTAVAMMMGRLLCSETHCCLHSLEAIPCCRPTNNLQHRVDRSNTSYHRSDSTS